VSRQLVRQHFPGDNPIGKHLHVPAHFHAGAPGDVDYEIVGVAGDTLYQVGKESKAAMYFPILEGAAGGGNMLAVHTASDPLQFSVPVQRQIASLDPVVPVSDVRTMSPGDRRVIGQCTPECDPGFLPLRFYRCLLPRWVCTGCSHT
jgi:hypothetical protein